MRTSGLVNSRGPRTDLEFMKLRDQMKTVKSQEEPPIYNRTTTMG
jgi:hypothetical protein